jgi:hypothetical protein
MPRYAVLFKSRDGQRKKALKEGRDVVAVIDGLCADPAVDSILSIRLMGSLPLSEQVTLTQAHTAA